MKSLFIPIFKSSVKKVCVIKGFLLVVVFLFALFRITPYFPKTYSSGFPVETIVGVEGKILSRPAITQGGDTGFRILLTKVINRRGWEGFITREVYAMVKGDLSRSLIRGDLIQLDSCHFFPKTGDDNTQINKNKRRTVGSTSLFVIGKLASFETSPGKFGFFKRIRKDLLIRIYDRIKTLPYRSRTLFTALFLGEKGTLGQELKEDISRVGCAHLLALSGFHVSILITMMVVLLKRFLGERKTLIFIIPILLIYLFLAGLFPSLIRAILMAVIGAVMVLSHKRKDKALILMISLFFQVLIFPNTVLTISFLLSYCAVIGIFFYTPVVDRVLSGFIPVCFSRLFSVSIGAQVINTPFVFLIFGVIYPIGLIVQILITPLITLFVWMGSFYLIFSLLPPFFFGCSYILMWVGVAMEWIYILVSKLCHFFSTMSFFGIHSLAGCCIFFFVLLIPLLFICVTQWRDTIAYRNFNDRL